MPALVMAAASVPSSSTLITASCCTKLSQRASGDIGLKSAMGLNERGMPMLQRMSLSLMWYFASKGGSQRLTSVPPVI